MMTKKIILLAVSTLTLFGWDDNNATMTNMFNKQMTQVYELTKTINPELYNSLLPWKKQFNEDYMKMLEKKETFFFFFSSKGQHNNLAKFFADIGKLKQTYPNTEAYAVLNGFPNDRESYISIMQKASKEKEAKNIKIKFLPYMYKNLKIDVVPAYAFAICPSSDVNLSECSFEYLVRGNIGVGGLLELMSEKDKKYTEVHHALIEK